MNKFLSITNIFVDCHVFDDSFQGSRTYLKGIYTEFIKDKTKHFFLASFSPESLKRTFGEHENVTYLKFQSKNKFYRLLIDIPKLIKNNNIHFAHFQYIVPLIKCCRFITTIHDVLFLDFPEYFPLSYRIKNKLLFYWSAKKSDIVLTVSEYSKKQIKKHFHIEHVYITSNAIDSIYYENFDRVKVKELVKSKYNIDNYWIFVSRREPRKNHFLLLRTFVEFEFYKDFHLVLIGEKAINDKKFNKYYNQLGNKIKERIKIFDKLDLEQLLLLLRGANLSVYPSIAEGFGIPPLEYLAQGIPTICSNIAAMADFDFMQNNLFNPVDINDIKDKALLALKEQNTSTKRELIRQKFCWRYSAEIFKKIIDNYTTSR
jgi:hypothetical protein